MDRLARIWARLWLWHDDDFRGCGRRCIFLHNLRHDSALELKRVAPPTFTLVIWAARPGKKRGAAASPSAASQQSYGGGAPGGRKKRGEPAARRECESLSFRFALPFANASHSHLPPNAKRTRSAPKC